MWEMFIDSFKGLFTGWLSLIKTKDEGFVFEFLLEKLFHLVVVGISIIVTVIYFTFPTIAVLYFSDCLPPDINCCMVLISLFAFLMLNIPVLAKLIPYINKKLDNSKDESR